MDTFRFFVKKALPLLHGESVGAVLEECGLRKGLRAPN